MRTVSLIKTPAETILHPIDLGGRGAAIGQIATGMRALVGPGALLAVEAEPVDGNIDLSISGGTDGEEYAVTIPVTLADGQTLEPVVEVTVVGASWSMPDGGAPMLSVAEFVRRIGRDKVLRLTDMGDGRIDQGLVVSALVDAQAQAEASLAGRYALPMQVVPSLVVAIISDLAHAALFEHEVPDNVDKKRTIALRNLDQLRKGETTLGVQAAAQTAAPVDPVRFDPGTRAYPDGLKDYGFQ